MKNIIKQLFNTSLLAILALICSSFESDLKTGSKTIAQSKVINEYLSNLNKLKITEPVLDADTVCFDVKTAKIVRIKISSVYDNTECCVDEVEIFAPRSKKNLALASTGSIARSSSALKGYPIHDTKHLIDGKYGNEYSWIAGEVSSPQWIEVELPEKEKVNKLIISRDRTGRLKDRKAKDIEVLVSEDGVNWEEAASVRLKSSFAIYEVNPEVSKYSIFQFPKSDLSSMSWKGLLEYSFLCEYDSWSEMPKDDYLTPSLTNRPASPLSEPYWGRISSLTPTERALVQFEEMIERFKKKGVDINNESNIANELRKKLSQNGDSKPLYLSIRKAKRNLFLRDPELEPARNIIFAKRNHYKESHNYSEHLDGILKPGGGVYTISIPRDNKGMLVPEQGVIKTIFDASNGIAREPVINYEGNKIYFSYRPDKPTKEQWESYWNIYETDCNGDNLKQLTDGPFHDFDPACLPDGGIAFISTRNKSRFLCWRPQAYVLYRMNNDGSNIKRLSHANLSEWNPSVTKDGRILWTRSEYLDKGADFGHTLWMINPDGTQPELAFGNNTPNCYGQTHEVPGTNELVSVIISHGNHDGPIVLIDQSKANDDVNAITNITPDTRPCYQMDRDYTRTFRNPYPISSDYFLVSHNPGKSSHYGIYIIDRYGNRELLYSDPLISSMHPRLFGKQERQYVLPEVVHSEALKSKEMGQFTVQDVYIGLENSVKRGDAKYLRVSMEMPAFLDELSDGQCRASYDPFEDYYATPVYLVSGPPTSFLTRTSNAKETLMRTTNNWKQNTKEIEPGLYQITENGGWASYVAKKSLGIVPIEKDGSVNFVAPANKVLYFHLLDSSYNEIQRMRSVIQLQAGEARSCIGCHEDRKMAPVVKESIARKKKPQQIIPDPCGDEPFNYEATIQPILDKSCVRCHNGSKPERPVLSGVRDKHRIPASFRSIIEGGYVHFFNYAYGMRHYKAEPFSFGTFQSKLWKILEDNNHKEVALSENDKRAIKLWIDLNCPLWPDYKYRLDR